MVLKHLFGKKDQSTNTGHIPSQEQATEVHQSNVPDTPEIPSGAAEPTTALLLEKAMLENARNDNTDTRYRVYSELLFSDLLLALAEPDKEKTEDNHTVNVAILSNQQNVKFAAAFTSTAAAKRWRPEGGNYVTMRGQDLFKLLEPSPVEVIVINAGTAPFIVLPKIEFRQLAAGIVPQSQQSPVQVASAPQQDQPQIGFPPDLLNAEQHTFMKEIIEKREEIEAAAFGVLLPPGAKEDGWIKTLFLRTTDHELKQEQGQTLFEGIHKQLIQEDGLLKELGFQMVHVPDQNFWGMVSANNHQLFDRNPPPAPKQPEQNSELQLAFPPDVFNAEQKNIALEIMTSNDEIEAAAIGAILPPGANNESGWIRTIFLRTKSLGDNQESMQKFCTETKNRIANKNDLLFKDMQFEVGVMPDPNFWIAINEQKVSLFDKNPPQAQAVPAKEGVVNANIT